MPALPMNTGRERAIFDNIDQVREANERAGHHFFERGSMRFFNSRILDGVYGGRYFITSERFERKPRRYTIREVSDNGHINTVKCGHSYANGDDHEGGFGCYHSAEAARAVARHIVAQVEAAS